MENINIKAISEEWFKKKYIKTWKLYNNGILEYGEFMLKRGYDIGLLSGDIADEKN